MKSKVNIVVLLILLGGCATYKQEFNETIELNQIRLPSNLDDLDQHLREKEGVLDDIRPEAEKKIFWANPEKKEQTEYSLIFLHGYTATRREISPGVELLAQELGANLFMTRLRGHGRTPESHKDVEVQDWLEDTLEALAIGKKLGRKVILVGASTGATLGAWIGTGPLRDEIFAHLYVSPNFGPADSNSEMLLWPIRGLIIAMMVGEIREFEVKTELEKEIWDYRHHSNSLVPMMQLVDFVRDRDFSLWSRPVFILHSMKDTVVNQSHTVTAFSQVKPELLSVVEVQESPVEDYHIMLGDAKNPEYTPVFVALGLEFLAPLIGE